MTIMQRYFVFILLICSTICFGQSWQSDSIYAIGVELYHKGKYAEAVEQFTQSNILDHKELDSLSPRREYSSMWLASCLYKMGREDEARKTSFSYKSEPVDRRQAVVSDSLSALVVQDIQKQRFFSALMNLKEVSRLEHQICDNDNFFHVGTCQMKGQCFYALQQVDSALKCFEEAYRIERIYYDDNDTILLGTVETLFSLNLSLMNIEKAKQYNKRASNIIKANYADSHPKHAIYAQRDLELLLFTKEWNRAHEALPGFVELLKKCHVNDDDALLNQLMAVRHVFDLCQRKQDVAFIDEAIKNIGSQKDVEKQLFGMLVQYKGYIESDNNHSAQKMEKEISRLLSKQPEDSYCEPRAIFIILKCVRLLKSQQVDKAKEEFEELEKQSLMKCVEKGTAFYGSYLMIKCNICASSRDFDGAIVAYTEAIDSYDPAELKQHPELYANLACYHVFAGKYKEALKITKKSIQEYESMVQTGGYRMKTDSTNVCQVIDVIQNNFKYAYNLPDSVKFTLSVIKCNYMNLLLRLLSNDEDQIANRKYLDYVVSYTQELVYYSKNYYKAQEVMEDYLAKLSRYIDQHPTTLNDWHKNQLLWMALRAKRSCFEKGDKKGVEAYLEYANFVKEYDPYPGAYEKAMLEYYQFSGSNESLTEQLIQTIETQGENKVGLEVYENLLNAMKDDPQTSLKYQKLYLKRLIKEYATRKNNGVNITNTILNIDRNYLALHDTVGMYEFYQEELWPAFDVLKEEYTYFFFQSIYEMSKYAEAGDEAFIPFIQSEMKRKPKAFSDNIMQACADQAIAGLFMRGGDRISASNYMKSAAQKASKNKALELLFLFGAYQALYLGDDTYHYDQNFDKTAIDSLFDLGHQIVTTAFGEPNLKYSFEICNLLHSQVVLLPYISQPLNYIEFYKESLKDFLSKEHPKVGYLFGVSIKNYYQYGFIHSAPLPSSLFLGWQIFLTDDLYQFRHIYPQEAGEIVLIQVRDEYKNLRTSMGLNSVETWQTDGLIDATSKYAYKYQTDSLKMYAYNTPLICKGVLLRSEHAFKAMIEKSGHHSALKKYEELQNVRSMMASSNERNIDSLLQRAESLEKDLFDLSRYFGDYTNALFLSWKSVQQQLKEGDIAIEFTHVASSYDGHYLQPDGRLATDENFLKGYYACVIKKDMPLPEIVFIAADDSIATTIDVYGNPTMTRRIMNPLKDYLVDVKNIYFSPIGELNQLAIESLPMEDDGTKTLSEKYNFFRLSSTRELVSGNLLIKGKDAVIYGGINYDISIESMEEDAILYPETQSRSVAENKLVRSGFIRGAMAGIPYLKGTKKEAEEITSTINAAHDPSLTARSLIGQHGTEASFKALSGQQKRVIHIATHGFYYSEAEAEDFRLTKGKAKMGEEKSALLRSGLFFAGAENIIFGDSVPDGVDDGVLLAQEISNTDLSGLDLVVLSACQTAQGHTTSEGVFGLQRGFKMAGANSILMSLWKVDDAATCFLMTEFYKNWVRERMTKHDAFEAAKQAVRSHAEKGWDDPKYWAAFILLDALD